MNTTTITTTQDLPTAFAAIDVRLKVYARILGQQARLGQLSCLQNLCVGVQMATGKDDKAVLAGLRAEFEGLKEDYGAVQDEMIALAEELEPDK